MKYNQEQIGKTIRTLRCSRNWSQAKLGDKISVTGKQISNYESGTQSPPIDILYKICDVFDCELGYLLGEEDYSSGTKILTSIEKMLGLNNVSIDSLKHLTGNDKSCISFGYESAHYQKILNEIFSSPDFSFLIEAIYDLDTAIEDKKKINNRLSEMYDSNTLKQAFEYYTSSTDYYHVSQDEQLPSIYYEVMNDIEKSNDDERNKSYTIKVLRYEVKEAFERLLDSLYS